MDAAQNDRTASEVGLGLTARPGSRGRWSRGFVAARILAVAVGVAASSLFPLRAALAQPTDQVAAADAAFHEAMRLMNEGKTGEACPKFAASHRLDPSYGAAYNLGTCYEKLGKTASAWAAYREAAELARKRQEKQRAANAGRRAAALEPKLTSLRVAVTTPVPGLSIKRNGAIVDQALWGSSIPVDPDQYTISATAPGRRAWSATVTVTDPGKTVTIDLPVLAAASDVRPSPGARGGLATTPVAPPSMPVQRVFALGAAGVGVTNLAVGTVLAVQATSTWNTARERHCNADYVCDARGVALHGEARTLMDFATAGFLVAGAGVAAAGVLWLTAPGQQQKTKSHDFRVAPMAGTAGGGVLVMGSF